MSQARPQDAIQSDTAIIINTLAEYSAIPVQEEHQQLLSNDPQLTSVATSSSHPITSIDGVFSNMNAKPAQGKEYEEIEPPSYHDTVVDPAPDYFVSTIGVNGFPIGNYMIFVGCAFLSMALDVIGFFFIYLIAVTHAARYGAQCGLGLTMMRYVIHFDKGFLLQRKSQEFNYDDNDYGDEYKVDPEDQKSKQEWMAIFIIVVGIFMIIRSNVEFYRLRRMKELIGSQAPPLQQSIP